MKKFLTLFALVVVVVALAIPTFAASPYPTTSSNSVAKNGSRVFSFTASGLAAGEVYQLRFPLDDAVFHWDATDGALELPFAYNWSIATSFGNTLDSADVKIAVGVDSTRSKAVTVFDYKTLAGTARFKAANGGGAVNINTPGQWLFLELKNVDADSAGYVTFTGAFQARE